jgi:hypoxanthine phosphoribosyltransferase
METLQVKDKTFAISIPAAEIQKQIRRVAEEINRDLAGREPLFLPVLNGSFIFAADLLREVTIPCEVSFIKLASYQGTHSTGEIREVIGLNTDITGRDVVIVEDIIDSGRTLSFLKELFKSRGAASIRVCTLLDKPSRRAPGIDIKVDYTGFQVPDKFVVGWGMDYDQRYRNLPYIGVITGLDEE